MIRLGVDTGGTFTDFVLIDHSNTLRVHKVLSTPHAPEQAILQGIRELGVAPDSLALVHGSTVATNALLERKGVKKTAYITNYGLRDMLTIGRQARRELYNLQPVASPPPVDREYCFETGGRFGANGEVVEPLTENELEALFNALKKAKAEAVAINLLFSFLDDSFERQIESRLAAGNWFVCRSSDVLPEYREYERGIATWLNAYVSPLVSGYLQRLQQGVAPAKPVVMQSSGGTIAAQSATRKGVNLLLSGPAGGLNAALYIGRLASRQRLLTFDMGGTSTDVALIDGGIRLTSEGYVGGYPVAVPMVDMHTIGAGGGSIARVDAGGMLQVGPESAGASPGPACYGQGGLLPTVTDANLVLGYLLPDAFLGGDMGLDTRAAESALSDLAGVLGVSVHDAARGIVRVANEHMAQALRVISVQRGHDPRDFTLMCFGGAGGLHVCALAELLGMRRAIVPVHGGVLSALGMLVAPPSRELSQTLKGELRTIPPEVIDAGFAALEQKGRAELLEEGWNEQDISIARAVDLRYVGQSYALTVPWDGAGACEQQFHATHFQRFGHKLSEPVELVSIRVSLTGPAPELPVPELTKAESGGSLSAQRQTATGVPLWQRADLVAGQALHGPALISELVSTTYIAPHWAVEVDRFGNLLLERL